jgi:hypothetical protein
MPGSDDWSLFEDADSDDSPWGDTSLPPRASPPEPAPARSFQAASGIQGRQFAEQCDTLLEHLGFTLGGRRVLTDVGVEVDQEAVSPAGVTVWFEYKGSVQGVAGPAPDHTLKKAMASGALLRAQRPSPVVVPRTCPGGVGAAMLTQALKLGYFSDVVCLDPTGRPPQALVALAAGRWPLAGAAGSGRVGSPPDRRRRRGGGDVVDHEQERAVDHELDRLGGAPVARAAAVAADATVPFSSMVTVAWWICRQLEGLAVGSPLIGAESVSVSNGAVTPPQRP